MYQVGINKETLTTSLTTTTHYFSPSMFNNKEVSYLSCNIYEQLGTPAQNFLHSYVFHLTGYNKNVHMRIIPPHTISSMELDTIMQLCQLYFLSENTFSMFRSLCIKISLWCKKHYHCWKPSSLIIIAQKDHYAVEETNYWQYDIISCKNISFPLQFPYHWCF